MNQKKKPVKITLDKLAEMSQREFVAVRGEMKARFDEVDNRFDEVDKRFGGVDKRFDGIDNQLGAIGEVLRLMREDLKEIKENTATNSFDYIELRTRVERLEKKTGLARR